MEPEDYFCPDCNEIFLSASTLLQHFALHANTTILVRNNVNERDVPDLYPLSATKEMFYEGNKEKLCNVDNIEENEMPLKICLVTINNEQLNENIEMNHKKYLCRYCCRSFQWSIDLKRHILTHTGERPFRCVVCGANFTRKFILQKHMLKHKGSKGKKVEIPQLKPIIKKKPNIKTLTKS